MDIFVFPDGENAEKTLDAQGNRYFVRHYDHGGDMIEGEICFCRKRSR